MKLAPAIRRLLDRLRLPVPARATAARQGGHRSPVLATGLEPADHRMYVPGDDVRRIDWNAFARLRQLTVRQFEEERDARVYVMLDCSGSMARGEPPKIEAARTLAASFAYLAMKQFDTVRVLPFRADADAPSPALRTRDRLPQVERFLGDLDAGGLTSFPQAVRAFARSTRGRGLVVLITDLMTPHGWDEGFRVLGGLGHQLTVVRVGCAEDDRPDLRGEIELVDAESGERLRIRSSKELLRAYRETVSAHIERCRGAVVRAGGRIVTADAETPPERLVRDVVGLAGKRQRGAA